MGVDNFTSWQSGLDSPGFHAASITPNDGVDLAFTTRAIYVGGAGDIIVDMAGGETSITFKAVPVGTTLWIRAKRVRATGTSATLLVALW